MPKTQDNQTPNSPEPFFSLHDAQILREALRPIEGLVELVGSTKAGKTALNFRPAGNHDEAVNVLTFEDPPAPLAPGNGKGFQLPA